MQLSSRIILVGVVVVFLSTILSLPTFADSYSEGFCRLYPESPICQGEYIIVTDQDLDNDGILDQYDRDIDNDGILDSYDHDIDNDGILDSYDRDIDNDGILDAYDWDFDNDKVINGYDKDIDNDGILDYYDLNYELPTYEPPKMYKPPTYEPPSFDEVGDPSLDNTEATCVLWGYNVNTGERECVIYSQY